MSMMHQLLYNYRKLGVERWNGTCQVCVSVVGSVGFDMRGADIT